MDGHFHPRVDVPVGNALGKLCQFPGALPLQLSRDAVLCDTGQQPLNVSGRTRVAGTFIIIVPSQAAVLRRGYLAGILKRDAAALLIRYFLLQGANAPAELHGRIIVIVLAHVAQAASRAGGTGILFGFRFLTAACTSCGRFCLLFLILFFVITGTGGKRRSCRALHTGR